MKKKARFDSGQLRYFAAVAEEGHIGRAALRLNLSQPALSRRIQLLESDLGVDLLIRTPKGVELTPAGESLFEDSRNIEQLVDLAAERAHQAGLAQVGTVDVGAYGSALYDYVPRLLARFGQAHPGVSVALHHATIEQLVVMMRQKRILLAVERRLLNEPDIESRIVARERAFVAFGDRHPLAAKRAVRIQALKHEPLILGRDVGRARGTWEFCTENGFEPKASGVASDMTAAVTMVASGLGTCIVPQCLTHLRLPGVVYRPLLGDGNLSYGVYAYWLKGYQVPLLASILDCVNQA